MLLAKLQSATLRGREMFRAGCEDRLHTYCFLLSGHRSRQTGLQQTELSRRTFLENIETTNQNTKDLAAGFISYSNRFVGITQPAAGFVK